MDKPIQTALFSEQDLAGKPRLQESRIRSIERLKRRGSRPGISLPACGLLLPVSGSSEVFPLPLSSLPWPWAPGAPSATHTSLKTRPLSRDLLKPPILPSPKIPVHPRRFLYLAMNSKRILGVEKEDKKLNRGCTGIGGDKTWNGYPLF